MSDWTDAEVALSWRRRESEDRGGLLQARRFPLVRYLSLDATPLLRRIAHALKRSRLEAIMVGNAAAALHGAPVTTLDFDFVFRPTPANIAKLKAFARDLGATIMRPYYPASDLYRVTDEEGTLQVDFLPRIAAFRSLERLRRNATITEFDGAKVAVASLADIIKSKHAANRPKDLAVLPLLKATLERSTKR